MATRSKKTIYRCDACKQSVNNFKWMDYFCNCPLLNCQKNEMHNYMYCDVCFNYHNTFRQGFYKELNKHK